MFSRCYWHAHLLLIGRIQVLPMSFLLPVLCYFFGKKGFVYIVHLSPQTFISNYKAVLEFREEEKYPVTFKLIICQVCVQKRIDMAELKRLQLY